MSMISLSKKYQTRDGDPVSVICVDRKEDANMNPVIVLVESDPGVEYVMTFSKGGQQWPHRESSNDLVEIPGTPSKRKNDNQLFKVGKTYKTRSGLRVRILCTDRAGNTADPAIRKYPIIGLLEEESGIEACKSWTSSGLYREEHESEWDLMALSSNSTTESKSMPIDMSKKYRTRRGSSKVRVLCTDAPNDEYPVVALIQDAPNSYYTYTYTPDGMLYSDGRSSELDLILVSWDHVKVDTRVEVRNSGDAFWKKAHFARMNESGFPVVWARGMTSWSSDDDFDLDVEVYSECRLPE